MEIQRNRKQLFMQRKNSCKDMILTSRAATDYYSCHN